MPSTQPDPSGLLTALTVLVAVWAILGVVVYVWYALALSRVFAALGGTPWKAWVPILNLVELFRFGGVPSWQVVFLFLPIVDLYGLYLYIVATHRINGQYGRGAGSTVLAVLLPPVWASVLGWGRAPDPEHGRLAALQASSGGYGFAGAPGVAAPDAAAAAHPPSRAQPARDASGYAVPSGAGFAPAMDVSGVGLPPAPAGWGSPFAPPVATPAPGYAPPAAPPAASAYAPPPGVPGYAPSAVTRGSTPPVVAQGSTPQAGFEASDPAPAGVPSWPGADPLLAGGEPPQTAVVPIVPPAAAPVPEPAPVPQAVSGPEAPVVVPPVVPESDDDSRFAPPASLFAPPSEPEPIPAPSFVSPMPTIPPAPRSVDPPASPEAPPTPVAASLPPLPAAPAAATPVPSAPAVPALADNADEATIVVDELDETIVVDRRPVRRWRLELDSGASLELPGEHVVLGRNPQSTGIPALAVPDETRTLSKTHARLDFDGERWSVVDLDSTNGVVVVDGSGAEVLLAPGSAATIVERVVLGRVGMRLVEADPA